MGSRKIARMTSFTGEEERNICPSIFRVNRGVKWSSGFVPVSQSIETITPTGKLIRIPTGAANILELEMNLD